MKIIKTITEENQKEDINYEIYVLCFRNQERFKRMKERFESLHIQANLCCFEENAEVITKNIKQDDLYACAAFYNQLSLIKKFYYESDKAYGVFFENDVYLKKTLYNDLKNASNHIKILNLDMLLIGYLIESQLELSYCKQFHQDYYDNTYYYYHDSFWGAQGFILTKNQAKVLIDKYTDEYIISKERTEVLSPDWVFTKNGKRALIYPPLVVEEGEISSDNEIHIRYHKKCKEYLYNDNYI